MLPVHSIIMLIIGIHSGVGQSLELNRNDVDGLWGYSASIYLDYKIMDNLMIEPAFSYSQKGSVGKIYETVIDESGHLVLDGDSFIGIDSRSRVVGFSLGVKPYYDWSLFRFSLLCGPRIDYVIDRTIDNTPLGGEKESVPVSSRWIPGLDLDVGCDFMMDSFLVGLVFSNELDLKKTEAEFGNTYRGYKYSVMLNVGYLIKS